MKENVKIKVDESKIHWREFVSEKGQKYEVGYLENPDLHEEEPALSGKRDFGIDVDWNVTRDSHWRRTSDHVKGIAAITAYNLYEYNGSTYSYKLEFENTEHYKYYFSDKTGDRYKVNTFRNGTHYVRYNSTHPEINYISGS